MKEVLGIIGAGGHGREIMPMIQRAMSNEIKNGNVELIFVIEGEIQERFVNSYPLISFEEFIYLSGK